MRREDDLGPSPQEVLMLKVHKDEPMEKKEKSREVTRQQTEHDDTKAKGRHDFKEGEFYH